MTRRSHSLVWFLLALPIGVFLSSGVGACGSVSGGASPYGRTVSSTSIPAGSSSTGASRANGYVKGDGDADGANGRDADDAMARGYGHAASPVEARTVASLVKRYYMAAAVGDGGMACRLLSSAVADPTKLPQTAEKYAPAPSAPPLQGKNCRYIMSLLFSESHRQLMADAPTLAVTAVRIAGRHCLALLAFRAKPEGILPLEREKGAWKIASLFDEELP